MQPTEELRQQKGYVKTLKKQSKDLKDLHKKHLKKVPSPASLGHSPGLEHVWHYLFLVTFFFFFNG